MGFKFGHNSHQLSTLHFCINMQYLECVVKGIKLQSESMGFTL